MDDIEYSLHTRRRATQLATIEGKRNGDANTDPVVREFHARYHQDSSVACLPVVVTDETALARGALALGDARHAEADVWWCVEGGRIHHSDTVPAGLYLYR